MHRIFHPREDSGMAMVLVVGSMMTLMVLVLGGLAYSMQSEKFSKYDQDYTAAMAAAQSGVEDYISRLNRNDTYHGSLDCTNTALKGPRTVSNACGWNASTPVGWVPVTGGAGLNSPHFHYTVDATAVNTQGTIIVTSTGRSGDVYRTVEVAVGKGGSTDYVYYTDFESADPANLVSYPDGAPSDACGKSGNSAAKYFWQGRSGCSEITFIASDTLDGRVFSNDAILSSNATFEQGIESANVSCQEVTGASSTWRKCLRSGSTGNFGKQPKYSNALYLPDNSAEFDAYPGCHYYGATRVIFEPSGKMRVWSKDSDFNDVQLAIPGPDGTTPSCGSRAELKSDAGALVDVPNDMVIYVAGAPSSVPRRQLFGDEIGGPSDTKKKLPLGNYSSALTSPTAGKTYTGDVNMLEATRFKGEGNLYVEGTLKGRVTVAAAQSVIVTGDLVLANGKTGTDLLGLVATNSVEVMHPRMAKMTWDREKIVTCTAWNWRGTCTKETTTYTPYRWVPSAVGEAGAGDYTSEQKWPERYVDPAKDATNPTTGIQIAGSIQTLQHSFFVQRYNEGPQKGTLLVQGSIAQRWRGAVGANQGGAQHGYDKLYTYDERLQYSAPPYFPHWANSEWSGRYSGETSTPSGVKTG